MIFHHVGCVVADIKTTIATYRPFALHVGEVVSIASQGVNVCFVEIAPGQHVELVEPNTETSIVSGLLRRRTSYYHLGFKVVQFDQAVDTLTESGYRHLDTFYSEAFEMRRCAFLASPVGHLIELIEQA